MRRTLQIFVLGLSLVVMSCASTGGSKRTPASETAINFDRRVISDTFTPPTDGTIKVAFFDADSTLRVAHPPVGFVEGSTAVKYSVSAKNSKDVILLPFVAQRISELVKQGYLIAIVSNQGGVAHNLITLDEALGGIRTVMKLIRDSGGDVHYYDACESDDHSSPDRKPNPGMGVRLVEAVKNKFGNSVKIDFERSFMVGDSAYKKGVDTKPDGTPGTHFSNADRLFAKNVGEKYLTPARSLTFFEPTDFFGWRPFGVDVIERKSQIKTLVDKIKAAHDSYSEYFSKVPDVTP